MKERQRHREAFEKYVAMGAGRSLVRLAHELDVSPSAVKTWSRELRWAERLEARSREVAETLAKESVRDEVDERKGDEQMVRLGLVTIAKALVDGRIKPTMSDLDRMIRLKRELGRDLHGRGDLEYTVNWNRPEEEPDESDPATVEEAREELRREVERAEGGRADAEGSN